MIESFCFFSSCHAATRAQPQPYDRPSTQQFPKIETEHRKPKSFDQLWVMTVSRDAKQIGKSNVQQANHHEASHRIKRIIALLQQASTVLLVFI